MRYLRNIDILPYLPSIKCGIFDAILGATTAAANIATDLLTTKWTNDTNKEIADANNATAIAIHESDKEFNAEQAQISREWNSEQAVMQRRAEAGINTSGLNGATGGVSGGSGAVASAPSAPTLSTPVMQRPDIDVGSAISSAVELAKAPVDIQATKANIKESEKRTELLQEEIQAKTLQNEFQNILNKAKPQEIQANLDYLSSQTRLNETNLQLANANILRVNNDIKRGVIALIQGFADQDISKAQIMTDYNKMMTEVQQRAHSLALDFQLKGISLSYQYGFNRGNTKGFNLGADASISGGYGVSVGGGSQGSKFSLAGLAGVGFHASMSSTLGVSGSYNSSNFESFVTQNPLIKQCIEDILAGSELFKMDGIKNIVQLRKQALNLITSRYNYLQEFFNLDSHLDGFINQQQKIYLPTSPQ